MTMIAIKSESIAAPDLFVKALVVLPETAVLAFHADEGVLYVRDEETVAALGYLTQAGISAQILNEYPVGYRGRGF